jgi:hypothetical protein
LSNWILLRSGAHYTFGSTECPALTYLDDVIIPLSRISRFGGHTTTPWSVAAHAVAAGLVAADAGLPKDLIPLALHHDDQEALVGDVVSPLKRMIADYPAIEAAAEQCLVTARKGRLPTESERVAIKAIDLSLLAAEANCLKGGGSEVWPVQDEALFALAKKATVRAVETGRGWGAGAAEAYMKMMEKYG